MMLTRLRIGFVLCAIVLPVLIAAPSTSSDGIPDMPSFTTLAGSGEPGIRDGIGTTAQFILPMGLAYDVRGRLFVADAGAQRVRVVTSTGAVSTLAGSGRPRRSGMWVPGGYADGPALKARFNRPSGLAVAADGSVFVADAGNHCIRRIKNGSVTTYAGSPRTAGGANGARGSATFRDPRALTFDDRGNLFVADYGTGVRKIDPSGRVSRLALAVDPHVTGVSFVSDNLGTALYIADQDGIVIAYDPPIFPLNLKELRYLTAADMPWSPMILRGFRYGLQFHNASNVQAPLGFPFAVAALARDEVLFTDVRTDSVRYMRGNFLVILTKQPVDENPDVRAGGFADGSPAEVNAPMGIAADPKGGYAIADSGNRRIRIIANFSRYYPVIDVKYSANFDALNFLDRDYRIAFVGNSFVYWDTDWHHSIESQIEDRLNRDGALNDVGKHARVYPVFLRGASLTTVGPYVLDVLSNGLADAVVFNLNTAIAETAIVQKKTTFEGVEADPPRWLGPIVDQLSALKRRLARKGIPLIVVSQPLSWEASPIEGAYRGSMVSPIAFDSDNRVGSYLAVALRKAGLSVIDLWPPFAEHERAAVHPLLFGSTDPHLSYYGGELAAENIAGGLERLRPWIHSNP